MTICALTEKLRRLVNAFFEAPNLLIQCICCVLVLSIYQARINRESWFSETISRITDEYALGVEVALGWIFLFIFLSLFFAAMLLSALQLIRILLVILNEETSLSSIVLVYFEFLLFFAFMYFLTVSQTDGDAISGLHPVKSIYEAGHLYEYGGWQAWHDLVLRFWDCFHFSVVTQTTLGYGDMLPKTVAAKVLVEMQVLIGLYLIVVSIGSRLK